MITEMLTLAASPERLAEMSRNIKGLALDNSDEKIVDEIVKILNAPR